MVVRILEVDHKILCFMEVVLELRETSIRPIAAVKNLNKINLLSTNFSGPPEIRLIDV